MSQVFDEAFRPRSNRWYYNLTIAFLLFPGQLLLGKQIPS